MDEKVLTILAGKIFALSALMAYMADREGKKDPSFPDDARARFDSYLGKTRNQEKALSTEARVQARELFNEMVGSSGEYIATRKPSLRRCLFNWLERG